MKSLPFILLALAMLSMAGCNGTTVYAAGAATGIWETRERAKPPADPNLQIAEHENWCYNTMGVPECFAHPQNADPDSLIMVDPANRYPLTNRNYWEVVYAERH